MRINAFILAFAAVFSTPALAENRTHRVVFEFTGMPKEESWIGILNNLENVKREFGGEAALELVAHGPGIELLLKKNTLAAERLRALSAAGIAIHACNNTLTRKQIPRSELFDFVTVVPSGIGQVVKRQEEGWAYIKVG